MAGRITPGPYEPNINAGASGTGKNPSPSNSPKGGSLQPGLARAVNLIKPPKTLTELIGNVGKFFGELEKAEEAKRRAELDDMVDMAAVEIKAGLQSVRAELDREGVGVALGSSSDYKNEYDKRSKKLLGDIYGRYPEATHQSITKKAYQTFFDNDFLAQTATDDLWKKARLGTLTTLSTVSRAQAANLGLPEFPRRPEDEGYAFGGLEAFAKKIDNMVAKRHLDPKMGQEMIEKETQETLQSRAEAMLRDAPERLEQRFKGPLRPGDPFGKMPEETRNGFIRKAQESIATADRIAAAAEKKRKAEIEDVSTAHLMGLVETGDFQKAKLQNFQYRGLGNLDDATSRAWDSFIDAAAERRTKVVEDPHYLLPLLMNPEKANIGKLADDMKAGRLSFERGTEIVRAQRQWRDAMNNKLFNDAVTEGREIINRNFGWTPFLDWKSDPRATAHLAAITEFNDSISRAFARGENPTALQIQETRDDILKRQLPSMKVNVQDKIRALQQAVPFYADKVDHETNVTAFEQRIRAQRGRYSDDQIARYRRTLQEIGEWQAVLQMQGATDHGRNPGGEKPKKGQDH